MGTVFQLPVWEEIRAANQVAAAGYAGMLQLHFQLGEDLCAICGARGIRCIAAHPHTDKKVLSQADFSGDCCLVFGSEGEGISAPEILAACDEAVAVPMANEVDSLNVGAAAAVFLYEVNRQREKTDFPQRRRVSEET